VIKLLIGISQASMTWANLSPGWQLDGLSLGSINPQGIGNFPGQFLAADEYVPGKTRGRIFKDHQARR
jgi:hypothetical protein